ncbi:hypothetical protein PF008_g15985 [Phytophthora fragariae]|uniref:Uncharacterized protein n=1 Tax=Phytophthora fragariae TaxID=53985 RepID=A0A6G0RCJ7_9STRA|nr:hypothetical protein PF008_g15985 [Phytophthora fragariae]
MDDDYFMFSLSFVRRKQARGTGKSSLVEHVFRAHADSYEEEVRRIVKREGTLDVIMKPKPRKYSTLNPICAKTLKKYMLALEEIVPARVKAQLSGQRTGFLVDTWTEDGTHFVAVASKVMFLLCFSSLEDEADTGADSIIQLMDDVLDTYGVDAAQLRFRVCDRACQWCDRLKSPRLDGRLCELSSESGVGGVSRPACQAPRPPPPTRGQAGHHQKPSSLACARGLMWAFNNATRWSSMFMMVHRYVQIRDVIRSMEQLDERMVVDLLPTPREDVHLTELYDHLKNVESVNKRPQTDNGITLADVCLHFEYVLGHYPETARYLAPDAMVIKYPEFQNNVIKVQNKESRSSRQERAVLARLLRPITVTTVAAPERELCVDAVLNCGASQNGTRAGQSPVRFTRRRASLLEGWARVLELATRDGANNLETILFPNYNRV